MQLRIPLEWVSRIGEWTQRAKIEDGRLHVETTMDQGERELILKRAAALRAERVQRDLSFGRQVASIPIEDYYRLLRERPALNSGDRDERERAWALLLSSPEGAQFKVTAAGAGRY